MAEGGRRRESRRGLTVALCAKRTSQPLEQVLRAVERVLVDRGCAVLPDMEAAKNLGRPGAGRARRSMTERVDLVVSLGGDGNLLSVARRFSPAGTPIIGVNLGRLGFLAEVEPTDFERFFDAYLDGDCVLERRMMLETELHDAGDEGETVPVLNDVVITKAALSRMLDFELLVNDDFVSSYRADGLIIATPTGSTAYSLAAGGPIMVPLMGAIVIAPICPHALSQRPLVVPDDSVIRLHLDAGHDDLYLSLDGQVGFPVAGGASVVVRRAEQTASIVRDASVPFYDLLRLKLGWGEGGSRR